MAARKQDNDIREKIILEALQLAGEIGWGQATFRDIAERSGLSLAELYALYESKTQILFDYERMLNKKVLAAVKEDDLDTPARDRLFDILMERFEAMNEHREALVMILHSARNDPKQAVIGAPHLAGSMAWMLEAAGIETNGLRGAARVAGLTGLYLNVVRTWAKDESEDLSATMAALDKALNRAERAANMFGL